MLSVKEIYRDEEKELWTELQRKTFESAVHSRANQSNLEPLEQICAANNLASNVHSHVWSLHLFFIKKKYIYI